jgi:hypothetical protein
MKKNIFKLAIAFFLFNSYPVFAQNEILTWFEAPLGELPPIGTYKLSYYTEQDVKQQDTSLSLFQHNLLGLAPLANKTNMSDLAVLGTFEMKDMKTNAFLGNTGIRLPNELYNLRFGPAYRYKFKNGWTAGIGVILGSASDKLFHSKNELSLQSDIFVRIPAAEDNSWVFFIDYNTNREFWRNIPIPGAAYWFKSSDKFQAMIGAPVASIKFKPFERLTCEATYIMVRDIEAKISYDIASQFYIYGGFNWNNELYARADRERNQDRIFYYEKLLLAGAHWQAFKYIGIDLTAGYSFDRFFFEGEKYDNKDDNETEIENGPFVTLRAGFPF